MGLNEMDGLTLFGLAAVTAMLVFYALEDWSAGFVLAFAAACALASVYGFLQGAWPFGVVEAIWSAVPHRRDHRPNTAAQQYGQLSSGQRTRLARDSAQVS